MHPAPDRPSLRVLLIDAHPPIHAGLAVFLAPAPEMTIIGAAVDGQHGLALVADRQPDLLIVYPDLPGMAGLEVVRQARRTYPRLAVLIWTGAEQAALRQALVDLGVQGYLTKCASGPEVLAAVRAVAAGRRVLLWEAQPPLATTAFEPLKRREQEVLRLLVAGRRNKQIAAALGLSVKTIELHVGRLFEKLEARSRTEVIRQAYRHGLVQMNEALTEPG